MLDIKIFTFLKVAELKNYTKAAAYLNLTQPAVSQHIRKLEEYYN
ncbi:MAG: LysR family transcriptional regulator [Tissierellia bacterium]|nr:LysR family transcriptional regulator [Tissierellia bacterium]